MKKKFWQCLVVFMTAFIMCMTSNCVVKAANKTSKANKTRRAVTATVMTSKSSSKGKSYTYSFTESDRITVEGSLERGMIIPITVKKPGQLIIEITGLRVSDNSGTYARLYNAPSCKSKSLGDIFYSEYSNPYIVKNQVMKTSVDKAGKYYLVFFDTSVDDDKFVKKITFKTYEYRADSYTMTSGKTYLNAPCCNYQSYRYYKIVLPEDGNILISSDAFLRYSICDSEKTKVHYDYYDLSEDNNYTVGLFLEKGTYYIRTTGATGTIDDSDVGPSTLKYTFYPLNSSRFTLKSGKTTKVYSAGEYSEIYLRFKADKTGYLKLTTGNDRDQSMFVTLCDSNRKCLSFQDGDYLITSTGFYSNPVVYGVKKGKTYYIKVQMEYDAGIHYSSVMSIKAKFVPVSEKSGSTRLSATNIVLGKTVKGTITIGSSRADWYKFTLSDKKRVNINISGNANGTLTTVLYDSDGQVIDYTYDVSGNDASASLNKTLEKGTYYIKIERYNSCSSGNYELTYEIN